MKREVVAGLVCLALSLPGCQSEKKLNVREHMEKLERQSNEEIRERMNQYERRIIFDGEKESIYHNNP